MVDVSEGWETARLTIEPITAVHASELHPLLADPALHEFTGGAPRSAADLETRYARLSTRRSADGSQEWGNWVVRLAVSGEAVGELQATMPSAGPAAGPAVLAWVIGSAFQGHGYASEAACSLVDRLQQAGWAVAANIHPDHVASQHVAQAAGLELTEETLDGEEQWLRS